MKILTEKNIKYVASTKHVRHQVDLTIPTCRCALPLLQLVDSDHILAIPPRCGALCAMVGGATIHMVQNSHTFAATAPNERVGRGGHTVQ
jgi:hypothetical protein